MEFKEIAVKAKYGADLSTLLAGCKVARLQEIAKTLELENASKLKKAELCDAIRTAVTDVKKLEDMALSAPEDAFQLASVLAFGKKMRGTLPKAEDFAYFGDRGCLFIVADGDSLGCEMPPELQTAIEAMKKNGLTDKRARHMEIRLYVNAMMNLYGVLPKDEVAKIFDSHHEDAPLKKGELKKFTDRFGNLPGAHYTKGDYFFGEPLSENDAYKMVLQQQGEKPRYTPDKYDLIKYTDPLYVETTPQIMALKQFIRASGIPEAAAQELLRTTNALIRTEHPVSEILNFMQQAGLRVRNERENKELIALLVETVNNTRLWSENGYSMAELAQVAPDKATTLLKAKQEPIRVHKVGRNDPCPCGSGKKYKKCCGRNL